MGKKRRRKKTNSSGTQSLNLLHALFADSSVVQLPKEPNKNRKDTYKPKPHERDWRNSDSSIKKDGSNSFKKWSSSTNTETDSEKTWERGAKPEGETSFITHKESASERGPWERGVMIETTKEQIKTSHDYDKTWSRGEDVPKKFNIWNSELVTEKNKSWKKNTTFIDEKHDVSGNSFWSNRYDTDTSWR